MAPANLEIPSGKPFTALQNVVYSVPAGRVCNIYSKDAVEASADGTTFATLTGANTTGVATAALFLRCTTADTVVNIKLY